MIVCVSVRVPFNRTKDEINNIICTYSGRLSYKNRQTTSFHILMLINAVLQWFYK